LKFYPKISIFYTQHERDDNQPTPQKSIVLIERKEEMKIFLQAALWALKDGLSLCACAEPQQASFE